VAESARAEAIRRISSAARSRTLAGQTTNDVIEIRDEQPRRCRTSRIFKVRMEPAVGLEPTTC